MATELTMPQMGYDMQEGTVVRWLKAEGSNVDLGEPVAEIETDKAVVEFESYASGVLREILVAEGSTVPVGEAIAVVGESAAAPAPEPEPVAEGESAQDAPAESVAQDGAESESVAQDDSESADSGEEVGGAAIPLGAASEPVASEAVAQAEPEPSAPAARVLATPIARQMARDAGIDLADIAGSGPGGRIVREDVLSAVESASAATEAQPETEPAEEAAPEPAVDIAEPESPEAVAASDEPEPEEAVEEAVAESDDEPEPEEAVEELVAASDDEPEPEEAVEEPVAASDEPEPAEAVEEAVAASDEPEPAEALEEPVAASDEPEPEEAVEEAVAESDDEPEPEEPEEEPVAASDEPEPAEAVEEPAASDEGEILALSRTRRQIARVTTRSKSEKPHFYVNADVDMTAAMALRAQINEALAADGVRVTVNDMIIAASVIALKRFPKFNAYYEEGGIRMNDGVNVGVAMALEEGLIMPAIVGAGGMSLREIAQASKDLSERAQRGSLSASEYSGGTFAVSNMGMLGVTSFVAIIQPPQTAVLAIGSVQKRAVVGDGDRIAVRQMMTATLSADHRIVDGAEGAMFVNEIRTLLENPLSVIL